MSLFHLKMACADAIWRIFIQPLQGRANVNSLVQHAGVIRPKDIPKLQTKPGFCRMHEVIEHAGIVSRLDCWRLQVLQLGFASLSSFADSAPTWEQLGDLATMLLREQVADQDFNELRAQPAAARDEERENMLLRQQYFLLYEEMSYALNEGDIGRVKDAFMPWVMIFKGCGKHKYAAHMLKHLHNIHFVYPEGLRYVVSSSSIGSLAHSANAEEPSV